MVSLQTSASFSYTLSINQCFRPPTTNLTPLLVRKELHDGLALETMLVMPSPTNSLMMTPRKSSTDLLSDPQILPIPIGIWYQMEGRAPRPPNPLSLSDLVSLAKTEELPDGCARDVWERLTSEYDLTEGEDKITLLSMFQQNQLEDVRTNISVGLTSMAIQLNKLKKLNHVLDEEYQITHILASLPREYSSVVEQVKIDLFIDKRTGSTLITMDEVKKRLKERYLQLKREHGWSEDEMTLNVKSGINQNKNVKKGSKGKYFKGRCNYCGKFGHKKADCWDLKNKKEKHQENEKKVQKD